MKNLLRSIAMAFTMFSRVPMPQVEWKPENMRDTLAAFPFVGVLLGLVLAGWYALAGWLSFDRILFSAGIALAARTLYRRHPPGRILRHSGCAGELREAGAEARNLKVPHAGAFAVIGVSAYLLRISR
jgi:adenosylcobinamide-GDP ribazoletransferase